MSTYTDINWLKKNHKMIHFFGLGFIQIKINDIERLHFYHESLQAFVDQPHNHRYDFTSTVLKGCLRNIIWKECVASEGEPCVLRYDSCTSDKDVVTPESKTTNRKIVSTFVTNKGSGYFMPKELFHQVRVEVSPTITVLHRGYKEYEFSSILEPVGFQSVCPFSRNLSETELWEIVEDCLREREKHA